MTKPVNIVRFPFALAGKNIDHFMNQLDFYDKKTQQERIDEVKRILYTVKVANPEVDEEFIDDFFWQYFEDWFKVSPNTTEPLSEDHEICRKLGRMSSYILYADGAERINKKTIYNFYPEKVFWKKINKEKSTEELAENNSCNENNDVGAVIDFLIRKTQNFKKQIKQKVTSKDLNRTYFIGMNDNEKLYPLKDYQKFNNYLESQLKKGVKQYKVFDVVEQKDNIINLKEMRNSIIDDQILTKDKLNGTIYFKNALPESTEIHWDMFDFFDKSHVMALLRIAPRDSLTDLDILIDDLESLLEKCNLSPFDSEVVYLYRKDLTIGDIAKRLDVESHIVNGALSRICNKVMDAYEDKYEDWYYLDVVKGKYKKCNQCGEIKIANERHFSKNKDSKDGFYSICKKCRQNGQN